MVAAVYLVVSGASLHFVDGFAELLGLVLGVLRVASSVFGCCAVRVLCRGYVDPLSRLRHV